jgi:antitoxin (DNA-binding transcriptional repressor) of toxin-antitoxin stability system
MSLPNNAVGTFDARTRFFELLERVEAGEEISIVRDGIAIAQLVPPARNAKPAKDRAALVPSLSPLRPRAELALS